MNAAIQLLLVASMTGTPVTVSTLDGETAKGELISLDSKQLEIEGDVGQQTFQLNQLMLLESSQVNDNINKPVSAVLLTDQSTLTFESLVLTEKNTTLQSKTLGEWQIPVGQIKNIRWGELDDVVADSWTDLQSRGARDDLLVFRKGDVLDYVAGTISQISDMGVTVTVRGRDLTAPLERVFAVVFANRTSVDSPGLGLVRTTAGDELKGTKFQLEDEKLTLTLLNDQSTSIDFSQVRQIDFGGGRIRFLADLPYDESASVSPDQDFPVVWFTARNFPAGSGGRRPLLIGGEQYSRGLWLHSGAVVRYRLNRQFSEFRTIAGFDQTHIGNMPRFNPKVKLTITGDNEQLYTQEFAWNDSPARLNLDLSNVRELVIRVESLGVGKGILEHFALGDAQLIK